MRRAVNVPHKGRDTTYDALWEHGLSTTQDAHLAVQRFCNRSRRIA